MDFEDLVFIQKTSIADSELIYNPIRLKGKNHL